MLDHVQPRLMHGYGLALPTDGFFSGEKQRLQPTDVTFSGENHRSQW